MRRIFREYSQGVSPREIAKRLNRDTVVGPSGATWSPSTINGNRERGTGILNNELYIGKLVWNRLRYMKDPVTGKRRSRLNPEKDWIVKEVPELRILPQELWKEVKARQSEMAPATRPDAKTEGLLGASTASVSAIWPHEMWLLRRQLYEVQSASFWLRRRAGPGDLHQSPHDAHRGGRGGDSGRA